jgi:ATP-binding cassette, subfamily B, multidrug efflux pump
MTEPPARSSAVALARTYGLPYLPWYLAGVVALLLTNGLSLQIPLYLGRGIDALAAAPGAEETGAIVLDAALAVAAMGVGVIVIRTASRLLFFTPGRLIEARVMRDLFAKVLQQQPDFFVHHSAGDLTNRLTSDVQQLRLLFGFTALGFVNTVAAVVLAGVQLVQLSTFLGLLVAAPLLLGFAITTAAVSRLRILMRQYQERLGVINDHALASFQGVAAIHAFGAAPALVARFRGANEALLETQIARSHLRIAIGPLLGLAAAVDLFLVLGIGGPAAVTGDLTAGEVVAFSAIIGYLVGPLRAFTFTWAVVRQASTSLDRLQEVLTAKPHRPDLLERLPPPSVPPALRVQGLTFRYPGADRDALTQVNVEVGAGQVLGVFGATGSGKTTLVRCLLRLLDPPPGTILADGVDVRRIDLDGWRSAAVLVPQRAFLFSESVRDNLLLGADDSLLEPLVRAVHLEADLAALPQGLDTVVGEAGLTVSGGQRQRVALARGLARDAKVLVLDDVLSAVDPTTEAALIETLVAGPVARPRDAKASGNRHRASYPPSAHPRAAASPTQIIVSNRVSAIRHADVILVLEEGKVVGRGSHFELAVRPGPYREATLRQEDPAAHRGES